MNLTNHTILITGGSTGIGLAFAAKFLELGNEVIITGRSPERLAQAKARYPKLHTIVSDVANPEMVAALALEVKQRFPKLDVLMNNAGVAANLNLAVGAADLVALTNEIDINLTGTIRTTSAFVDLIRTNKGTIINVSSGLALVPLTCAPIYSATKAALHSYTTSLRFHLQDAGVRVVELMPPAIATELTDGLFQDGDEKDKSKLKLLSTDDLVAATMADLTAGKDEILPGQSKQLYWMSRLAPRFINRQLFNATRALIPA